MLKNILGHTIEQEQAIFPFFSFLTKNQIFRCLGTGFFVNPAGWFITAKHVLFDNEGNLHPNILAVQTLTSGISVNRTIKSLSVHPMADIVVGILGNALDGNAQKTTYEFAPTFNLSFKKLNTKDKIISYGYPKTTMTSEGSLYTFHLTGKWSEGEVEDFHTDGISILKNRCYRTSMLIETGSSGGPVFNNNRIIGINSSGWDFLEGEAPLSFITPVDYILDLSLQLSEAIIIPIKTLVAENMIVGNY